MRAGRLEARRRARRATLGVCGAAHFVHDGFSALLYLVLPSWQAEFGLSLAQVGLLKSVQKYPQKLKEAHWSAPGASRQ